MAPSDTLSPAEPGSQPHAVDRIRAWGQRFGPPAATCAVPFLLIVYLALRGGGYDSIVRSEIGIAVWWVVLLGAIVGLLPTARITSAGWAGVALLGAFGAWTGFGLLWSESSERSMVELARVSSYLGILILAISVQGRDGLRQTIAAAGAALAVVGSLALLSRLQPGWFPANDTADVLEIARARLNYPVDYWNGLAALMAIGTPLMLVAAVEARLLWAQALATAALPVMALACFYTLSRGGVLEMSVALIVFFALYPRRLAAVPTAVIALTGSVLVIAAATQRNALEDGLTTPAALEQGDQMLAIVLVVCAGVGLLRGGLGLAVRHGIGPRLNPSRQATLGTLGAVVAIALVGAVATGAPGKLDNAWETFKAPAGPAAGDTSGRFQSASGNGRYQYWQGAVDANATDPIVGIGPGTFEYYWAREGTLPGFIRDAHSLYFETFGELGLVGLVLVLSPILALLWFGLQRSLRGFPEARPWLAAGTAASATFATAAAVDWVWELAVIPVVFLCIVAALLSHRDPREPETRPRRGWRTRGGLALLAVPSVVAIGIPLIGAKLVEASQDQVKAEQLVAALGKAREADDLQPWAATPPLQQALILELQGDLDEAATAAAEATAEEPTNWRTWFILSRIEAARGDGPASEAAQSRAAALNPRSALFAQ